MTRRFVPALAALTGLALSAPAAAQEPAQIKPFTLEVEVDVVSVTAVVFDKKGMFIRDLDTKDVELYEDGILEQPEGYASPYPDLLTFHDAPTPIEQRLFAMHLEHRMRAFQGEFHANPDYALWYGWSEMVRDLSDIKEMAEGMRRAHADGASH